jgi:hypothetical protein
VAVNGQNYVVESPFLNNTVPLSRQDPVALRVQALIPTATSGNAVNNLLPVYNAVRHTTIPALKLDHLIGSKHKISFYWSESNTYAPLSPIYGNAEGLPSPITEARGSFVGGPFERLNYDYTVSPTVVAHVGVGYQQNNFFDNAPVLIYNARASLGLVGATLAQQRQRHPHVTQQLLWEEYRQANPDGYRYSRFCELYQRWRRKQDVVLRQEHKTGEKLFVDWAGSTIPIYDPSRGPVQRAHLFVTVLGASSYTYAEATADEQLANWIGAHVRAFEFYQGVPKLVVPDNTKTGVTKACRYDPDLNPTYQEMAMHTAWAWFRHVPTSRATRPRSNVACCSSSAGSSRPCATGSSSQSRN